MGVKFRTGEELDSEKLLGIKEEDLKNQLKAGAEAGAKVTELDTKMTSGFDEIKTILAGLTSRGAGNGGNDGGTGGNGDGNDGGGGNGESVDPSLAVAMTAQKTALDSKIGLIKLQMRDSMDSEGGFSFPYWDQLSKEMEELTKNDTLIVKSNPAYWENVYHICYSKNHKKFEKEGLKGRTKFTSEPINGTANVTTVDKNKPSEIDIQQAAKFRIPIEKYMESKSKMQFVGV
jgi:hypothetical protein